MSIMAGCTLDDLIRANQVRFTKKQKFYLRLKRVLDFICTFIVLIVLLPVFMLVAIAIKLDSPKERVIFKQERIGQNGRTFLMYKFRSMKCDAPELGTNEFMDADQYITKVGRFIRKTSLDELPQLWCVLRGTMSLSGPRPLLAREEEVHFLRNYYGIYQVKPGITGLAQINGRDEIGDYEKVRWDRAYVRNISLGLDLKILWRTVIKVIKHDGVVDDAVHKEVLMQENGYLNHQEYEKTVCRFDEQVKCN